MKISKFFLSSALLISYLIYFSASLFAVNPYKAKIDSLQGALRKCTDDTTKARIYIELGAFMTELKSDSALLTLEKGLDFANKAGSKKLQALAYLQLGVYFAEGFLSIDKSIYYFEKAAKLYLSLEMMFEAANAYRNIGHAYFYNDDPIRCIANSNTALKIFQKIGSKSNEIDVIERIGYCYSKKGDYIKSLEYHMKALKLAHETGDKFSEAMIHLNVALVYSNLENFEKGIEYSRKSLSIFKSLDDTSSIALSYNNIGSFFMEQQKFDSALYYLEKSLEYTNENSDITVVANINITLGETWFGLKDFKKADIFFKAGLENFRKINLDYDLADSYLIIGKLYLKENRVIEAKNLVDSALRISRKAQASDIEKNCYKVLSEIDLLSNNYKGAYENYVKFITLRDTIQGLESSKKIAQMETEHEFVQKQREAELRQKQKDAIQAEQSKRQRIIMIFLSVGLFLLMVFLYFVYKSLKQKKRANALLKKQHELITVQKEEIELKNSELVQQNEEITAQRDEIESQRDLIQKNNDELLEQKNAIEKYSAELAAKNEEKSRLLEELQKTLSELKETQEQLVQSEKLASLGQLTAGIAHEIQNPLNFVNNFSALSIDLVQELGEHTEKLKEIADKETLLDIEDVTQMLTDNMKKINEHGKRADGIVKGMLQHSRGKSGEFELVEINSFIKEYTSLAYHGVRAQDKNFNTDLLFQFDENVGKVRVVPQDFSRVILNIVNNSCYALNEKKIKEPSDFKPQICVATTVTELGDVIICIKDNGTGIPQEVLTKVFNPFFTTKPTGKGTGLGLSMTFDIVVKIHKGKLDVKSEVGKFTEFVIILPKSI